MQTTSTEGLLTTEKGGTFTLTMTNARQSNAIIHAIDAVAPRNSLLFELNDIPPAGSYPALRVMHLSPRPSG